MPPPPQPTEPVNIAVFGINNLAMSQEGPLPGPSVVVQAENSFSFTTLAASINIGLQILETPQGREKLSQLGQNVVTEWARNRTYQFGGDVRHMPWYINHFLQSLRGNFPSVVIRDLGGPDSIALTGRLPGWRGPLTNYQPKFATGLAYNIRRVEDMSRAFRALTSDRSSKAIRRYKDFLFIFGIATAHELCHAFVGYLCQNVEDDRAITPPAITHLNYGHAGTGMNPPVGESGRYFERILFGGSIEFYRDLNDDAAQAGIPHVLDNNGIAWRIAPDVIFQFVEKRTYRFPLATQGSGISPQQRAVMNLRSLGSGEARPQPLPGSSFMRARIEYNVSGEELRRIANARQATMLRAVRVTS